MIIFLLSLGKIREIRRHYSATSSNTIFRLHASHLIKSIRFPAYFFADAPLHIGKRLNVIFAQFFWSRYMIYNCRKASFMMTIIIMIASSSPAGNAVWKNGWVRIDFLLCCSSSIDIARAASPTEAVNRAWMSKS